MIVIEKSKSGKRDSNSRPQPWQGCALPTELFPPKKSSEEDEPRTHTSQLTLPPQSSASTNSATPQFLVEDLLCPEQDSNLHVSQHSHLKRARLPFRHLGSIDPWVHYVSGKRDSNSRPQPWQGCALPTELFPLGIAFSLKCGAKIRVFLTTTKYYLKKSQKYFQ